MNEIICSSCNGTNQQHGQKKEADGTYSDFVSECLCSGTPEEIWQNVRFLLAQFIRCKVDGPFDGNPDNEQCDGCAYEREEILNHMWHFGNRYEPRAD